MFVVLVLVSVAVEVEVTGKLFSPKCGVCSTTGEKKKHPSIRFRHYIMGPQNGGIRRRCTGTGLNEKCCCWKEWNPQCTRNALSLFLSNSSRQLKSSSRHLKLYLHNKSTPSAGLRGRMCVCVCVCVSVCLCFINVWAHACACLCVCVCAAAPAAVKHMRLTLGNPFQS